MRMVKERGAFWDTYWIYVDEQNLQKNFSMPHPHWLSGDLWKQKLIIILLLLHAICPFQASTRLWLPACETCSVILASFSSLPLTSRIYTSIYPISFSRTLWWISVLLWTRRMLLLFIKRAEDEESTSKIINFKRQLSFFILP